MYKASFILLIASVGFAGFYFDWLPDLSEPEEVREMIASFGLLAPIVFVLLISLLNPFFVPVLAFAIPGALIWGFPVLLALTWLGVVGSSAVGFFFARFLARDYVAGRLPAKLRVYDKQIAENGFRTTVVIRLVVGLIPPSHWLLGVSKINFVPYLLGSAIGFFPLTLILTYVVSVVGSSVGDWLKQQPPSTWWVIGAIIVLLFTAKRLRDRKRGNAKEEGVAGEEPEVSAGQVDSQ